MAEEFEDSYSAEALANMENYIVGFGALIKDVGSGEAFKNALFGMKVMLENKPRRVADLSKIYTGHRPMTLELLVFSRVIIAVLELLHRYLVEFLKLLITNERKHEVSRSRKTKAF